MNKFKKKIFLRIAEWLEKSNSNRYLNTGLLTIVILIFLAFILFTFDNIWKTTHLLIVPIISIVDIYLMGSKNHAIKEAANFVAALIFIGFLICAITLAFMGFVIFKSL